MNNPERFRYENSVRIVVLSEEGLSLRQISQRLGVSHSTVSRCLKRYRETGRHTRRPGGGRPRVTDPIDDRYLRVQALRARGSSATALQGIIAGVRNLQISTSTVRRRLREAGLASRRPMTGPLLTREHRRSRLRFALEHRDWTIEDWKRVLFTDETRVSLHSPDGRERVWRRHGERHSQACITPRVAFGGGSIMFWGGISWEARTELVVVRGRGLTSTRYIEEILQDQVMPYMPFIGPQALFMQDNARPHKARCVMDYLNTVHIHSIEWPARSPDLNIIEHLWDSLKRRVRLRNRGLTTLAELETVVLEEWENIPQDFIQDLFRSMPRRMEAVLRARGGNTAY